MGIFPKFSRDMEWSAYERALLLVAAKRGRADNYGAFECENGMACPMTRFCRHYVYASHSGHCASDERDED